MHHKIKTKLFPNIGKIAIVYGSIAFIARLIAGEGGYTINHESTNSLIALFYKQRNFLQYLAFPHFPDVTNRNFFHLGFNPIDILFYSMIIVGGILYNRTQKKDARLLRFVLSIMFFKGLLLIFYTLNFFSFRHLFNLNNFFTIVYLCVTYISYHFMMLLIAEQKFQFNNVSLKGEEELEVKRASRTKRVLHLIFDDFIALQLLFPSIMVFLSRRNIRFGANNEYEILGLILLSILLIYYLIFEGLFNSTPSKFLTGSIVTSIKIQDNRALSEWAKKTINPKITEVIKPSFGQIVGRTFSRKIPLESWSFFGSKGWHDTLSKTTVIEENTEGKSRRYHIWWPIIYVSLYLVGMLYKFL